MTTVPLSKGQHSVFTPASLENLNPKPVFRFRAPTPRDKEDYRYEILAQGLRYHSEESFHVEIIHGMTQLWSDEDEILRGNIERLKNFWEAQKQAAGDPAMTIDPVEAQAVQEMTAQIVDRWPTLPRMFADNHRFTERAPRVALSLFLAGWSDFDMPFRLDMGRMSDDAVLALSDKLNEIEEQAVQANIEGVSPSLAFSELSRHALSLMGIGADAEKNLRSPSSQSDTPSGSKTGETVEAPSKSETTASPARRKRGKQ